MPITVREFKEEDVAAVALLERACFADAWSLEMLKSGCARGDFCGAVAEEDGKLIGYVYGTSLFEDAEIPRIAVSKEYRGKGYGGILIERFFEIVMAKGARRIFLEVRVSNAPALGLYQSRGFEKLRIRKRYYEDGEDAMELKKELYPEE